MKIDNGLIIDETKPGTCAGYVFNFARHGAFAPGGKVGEFTQAEIDAHNELLSKAEYKALIERGIGALYLFRGTDGGWAVGTWASKGGRRCWVNRRSESVNNWGAKRTDVWFTLGSRPWHGVNVGDNDIVRVKRLKVRFASDKS